MQSFFNSLRSWLVVLGLVYLLLVAVAVIGGGFKLAAGGAAAELFGFAGNPIAGVVVGMLATALIQSSSTVTSIIVGLVAGGLPVSLAVPMVMGANIGTTVTNTIVSLGHIRRGEEFRRAFAAATVHDFFNLLAVLVFLPLEIAFDLLERAGVWLSHLLAGGESVSVAGFNFMKAAVSPPVDLLKSVLGGVPEGGAGVLMIALGVVFIFIAIAGIGRLLRVLMVGRARRILHTAVGRGPLAGIASGTLVTVLVQSSSTTTSLIVPLAGTGVFSLRQVYPFTLGANIGTCITGLLAATAISGDNAIFALQIALIHLLYNSLAVGLIYSLPVLRGLPLGAADWLAGLAERNKMYVAGYLAGVFVGLPILLLAGGRVIGF